MHFSLPSYQHLAVYIEESYFAGLSDLFSHADSEVGRASGYVYRALALLKPRLIEYEAFPEPVRAEAHQVVHKVVLARYGVKDIFDHILFFFSRDDPVSKMRLFLAKVSSFFSFINSLAGRC